MKKIMVVGLVFFFLLTLGCQQVPEPAVEEVECFIQSCELIHDVSCGTEPPGPCLLILKANHICGQYVSCTAVDDECQVSKDPQYDLCLDCFQACDNLPVPEIKECVTTCGEQFPKINYLKTHISNISCLKQQDCPTGLECYSFYGKDPFSCVDPNPCDWKECSSSKYGEGECIIIPPGEENRWPVPVITCEYEISESDYSCPEGDEYFACRGGAYGPNPICRNERDYIQWMYEHCPGAVVLE